MFVFPSVSTILSRIMMMVMMLMILMLMLIIRTR